MAFDLAQHPHFRPWSDPISGVTSHVLVEQVAPIQHTFPSPHCGVSGDERWLWFACLNPPNPQPCIGLVSLDPKDPVIRIFPQAGYSGTAPLVAPEGDSIYFCCRRSVYRMNVHGHYARVCTLPQDYVAGRRLWRLATYLSLSADGRYLLLDGLVGHHSFLALGDLASGQVQVVREFQAHHGNGQFSPVGDRILLAQLPRRDPQSGLHLDAGLRLHQMELDGSAYHCLTPHLPCDGGGGICYEWWGEDGAVRYVERETGVWRIDPETRRHDHLWREPLAHADCDRRGRFLCADRDPMRWRDHPMAVLYYDSQRRRGLDIDSGMPTPAWPRREVAVAPVPCFSPQASWIAYTTTRRGGIDLALCPTRDLEDELARQPALEAEREADTAEPLPPRRAEATASSDSYPTWGS